MPYNTKLSKQTLNLEWKNQRRSSNGLGVHFHQPVRLLDASQNSAQGIRAAHRKCRGQGPDAIYGQTPSGLAETWGGKRKMSSIEPLREFHWRVGWLGLCGGSGVFESHRDSRELLFEPRVSTFGDRPWVLSLIAIKPAGVTPSCRWLPTRNLLWALLRGCAGRDIAIVALQRSGPGLFRKIPGQHHEPSNPHRVRFGRSAPTRAAS